MRVTACKMEGGGHGEEQVRKRVRHRGEGPEQDFCFLVGLHANMPERIVQLRELKKMYNPGQRDGEGGGRRGRGSARERDEGRAQKKRRGHRLSHSEPRM